MQIQVLRRAGHDPAANLAHEEALYDSLRPQNSAAVRPTLLFYVNSPCVVLGRSNRDEEWVDQQACAADGIPVLRRFSGGGTVYHDLHNLNFSFILSRASVEAAQTGQPGGPATTHFIEYFRGLALRAFARLGPGFSASGLSDIALSGRKVSGSAMRLSSGLVLHHATLMLRCDIAAIERYLPIPPNRPGVRHSDFVTSLEEQGLDCSAEDVMAALEAEFTAAAGAA
ncbi:lipoate--protein ligase family protein [bacterium]|nr:lipoate--protein ligase family protein [bacterium]